VRARCQSAAREYALRGIIVRRYEPSDCIFYSVWQSPLVISRHGGRCASIPWSHSAANDVPWARSDRHKRCTSRRTSGFPKWRRLWAFELRRVDLNHRPPGPESVWTKSNPLN